MKELHSQEQQMSVIPATPEKHFYAICCSLKNSIYVSNIVLSLRSGII